MSKMNQYDEFYDLVIVGSGFSGLCAAKTHAQVNPDTSYAVFEAAKDLGGVWTPERIYPHLRTNNLYGFFEYSDFPSTMVDLQVPEGSQIPGAAVNKYLRAYADHFGVSSHIRFSHYVQSAEYKGSEGWLLTVKYCDANEINTTKSVFTSNLIVGCGLCSRPQVPSFSHIGGESFSAPIIHGSQMASQPSTFADSKSVAVLGGTKLAWDAAFAYASAGVQVHWIIRASGHGPCWVAPSKVTPLQLRVEELVMTRLVTWFSPSIWGNKSPSLEVAMRKLLQNTWFGRILIRKFFKAIQKDVCDANRYDRCQNTAKLKPWTDFRCIAGGQGVISKESNVLDLVEQGRIQVHIDEISRLGSRTVHLRDGGAIPADALVCCTGWRYEPGLKFLPEGIEKDIGLPHYAPNETASQIQRQADATVLSKLPILEDDFPQLPKESLTESANGQRPNQPYRLYRFMAPQPPFFQDRNLAFLGMQINFGVPMTVQAQALWIAAYFGNHLSHLKVSPNGSPLKSNPELDPEKSLLRSDDISDTSPEDLLDQQVRSETMLHTRFCVHRYPWGFGERFPDFLFELLPYLDMLLVDLGLDPSRKIKNSASQKGNFVQRWWHWAEGHVKDVFEPYGKKDYVGLTEEWLEKKRGLKLD